VQAAFDAVGNQMGHLDSLLHAIAFAKREDLDGRFKDTSRDGFELALGVSAYSLNVLTQAAEPLMKEGSSIVALTFLGSERAVPNYNVMGVAKAALEASVRYLARDLGPQGIRVNALSAGPIKTLASRGIKDFPEMLRTHAERSAMKRNVTVEEVGQAGLFLCSPMSSGMTGDILYVDAGYRFMAG
jgi:enoyl-[acyl-carrier protein] reductase I